jgi:hypothetical protein
MIVIMMMEPTRRVVYKEKSAMRETGRIPANAIREPNTH